MLDHVSLPVLDIDRSAEFYDAVLAVLGIERQRTADTFVAYGRPEDLAPGLWLLEAGEGAANPGTGLHLSFRASSHQDVDLFYETALSLGAKSAGAPGHRPQYTAHFYGAFVIDINGFKIEATHRHR